LNDPCVPYPRKSLYLILTIPMIAGYLLLAVLIGRISAISLFIYLSLFLVVAVAQSYVCIYWQCPYVGKFAPCVGGFCLPASRIALLLRNVKRTEGAYKVFVNIALLAFLGIIIYPIYFVYLYGMVYLVIYFSIVAVYAILFLGFICPVCATRKVCPGGQTSAKLRELMIKK
jgi:hypothetical protein